MLTANIKQPNQLIHFCFRVGELEAELGHKHWELQQAWDRIKEFESKPTDQTYAQSSVLNTTESISGRSPTSMPKWTA